MGRPHDDHLNLYRNSMLILSFDRLKFCETCGGEYLQSEEFKELMEQFANSTGDLAEKAQAKGTIVTDFVQHFYDIICGLPHLNNVCREEG